MFNQFFRKALGVFLLTSAATALEAAPAQFAFRVSFTDKSGSPPLSAAPAWLSARSMARRAHFGISLDSTDRPVSRLYVDTVLQVTGGVLHTTSRWLNNCVVLLTDSSAVQQIRSKPYVTSVEWVGYFASGLHSRPAAPAEIPQAKMTGSPSLYGSAWLQTFVVHGDYLHDLGFRGAGKLIVMMDGNFEGVDKHVGFQRLRNEGRILETYNVKSRNQNVYLNQTGVYARHGMECLGEIVGYDSGKYVGCAPEAEVAMYVTEDNDFADALYELDNFIAGLERADSLGADVLSASLLYKDFTSPYAYSFTKSDLDGHTTIVSRATNMAVAKGIFCVIAAGNDGNKPWNYLYSPGDADSALTIGSVDIAKLPASISSPGPNASGRVKPDLCFVADQASLLSGTNGVTSAIGTSYATPQAAGYVACLLQAFPDASLYEIRQAMIRSADCYAQPTAKKGYGVPDFRKVFSQLGVVNHHPGPQLSIHPNPFGSWLVLTIPNQATVAECSLTDIMGRNVPVRVQRSGIELRIEPVSILPVGVYVLKAEVDGVHSAIRVVHE